MTKGRFLQIESPEILHRVTSETWHCMYGCVHTLDIDERIFRDITLIKNSCPEKKSCQVHLLYSGANWKVQLLAEVEMQCQVSYGYYTLRI